MIILELIMFLLCAWGAWIFIGLTVWCLTGNDWMLPKL